MLVRTRAHNFEDRFVAFVDILGFRDIVKRMQNEPELFNTVKNALGIIADQVRAFREYRRADERKTRRGARALVQPVRLQMTAFSDCYVVSDVSPAWHVVAAVQALGSALLADGILSRGSIVFGPAHHTGRVLFGPAVIEAYELERGVAKYPRIIVSDKVRAETWGYHMGLWKGQLFRRDNDGWWFVNVLTPTQSAWQPLTNRPIGGQHSAIPKASPTDHQAERLTRERPREAIEVDLASALVQPGSDCNRHRYP